MLFCLACTKKHQTNEGRAELRFWHSFVASTRPALQELIKRFEQEHPRITIREQYVPTGDALIQKLITAVQSKTAPDISWIHADFLDKLAQSKSIYPISYFSEKDSLDFSKLCADIFPPLLAAGSWKDTLYALPMEATALALVYNKRLFRDAGLDPDFPPKDWEELKRFTVRLTRDSDGDGRIDQYGFYVPVLPPAGPYGIWMVLQWSPFLWQAGGRLIDASQSHITFNSIAGRQALTLWKDLYRMQKLERFSQAHDMGFVSGTLAMIIDGPWNLPVYRRAKQLEWGVAALPAGPQGRATYLAGEQLVIFRQTKIPDEAWTFVRWILQSDVQAQFSIASGYLPVRRSVRSMPVYQEFLDSDRALRVFVDQMDEARERERIDINRVEINRCVAEAIEAAIRGDLDAQQALDQAAEKAEKYLKNIQ